MAEDAPRLSRPVRWVFALTLAAYGAIAVWLVWRTSVLEPYSDMIDWAERWLRLQADHDLAQYFWVPHNFHHLVLMLAVLDADIRLFGGQGYLFLAVGVACLAATAAMMTGLAVKAAGPGLRLLGGGMALAICLMGCQVLDANTIINTTYLHALAFALAAVVLAGAPGEGMRVRRAAALACAVAAGLGSAAGMAVWPALAFEAWRGGRRGWLLVILAAGIAFAAVYMVGEGVGGGLPSLGRGGPSPVKSMLLLVNFLGLPWMRGLPAFGGLIGLGFLCAALAALLFQGGPGADPTERTAVALIVLSLGTAALAGLARTGDIAPALVPMRYSVFLIPLQVGLWILALPYVRRASARWPRAAGAATLGLSVCLLAQQGAMALYAIRTGDINLRIVADYRQGVRTPDVVAVIYPLPAKALAVTEALKRRGLFQRELRPDPPPQRLNGSDISASSTGP